MNSARWMKAISVLCLLTLLQGCDEKHYVITTIVSLEGTIDRILEWHGPSDSTRSSRVPFRVDSTWKRVYTPPAGKDSVGTVTWSKRFDTFEAFSQECGDARDSGKVRASVRVERRFRWFYTYFDYTETYGNPVPVTLLPATQYFTPDELRRIVAGDLSDTLGARIKSWQDSTNKVLLFTRLLSAVGRMHDPQLTPELFTSRRGEMIRVLAGDSIYKTPDREPAKRHGTGRVTKSDAERAEDAAVPALRALQDMFRTEAVRQLREPFISALDEVMSAGDREGAISGSYTNRVVMPGVILDTNAPEVAGNRASWKIDGRQIFVADIPMHVVSRVVNAWAIVASALAVAGLVLFPLFMRRRRTLMR